MRTRAGRRGGDCGNDGGLGRTRGVCEECADCGYVDDCGLPGDPAFDRQLFFNLPDSSPFGVDLDESAKNKGPSAASVLYFTKYP